MATAINQYGIKTPTDKKKKKKESLLAKPKKKYKAKRYDTSALAAGQQVLTARKGRKDRGKKYGTAEAGEISRAKAKKAMTSDKAYALPFGETFKQARKEGKKTFRWKSKQYHTKTKSELEKATGAKEKERFERAGKAKQVPVRKSATFAADAKADRVRAKRIAWMEKRKKEGKSYSKKNLAELKAKS